MVPCAVLAWELLESFWLSHLWLRHPLHFKNQVKNVMETILGLCAHPYTVPSSSVLMGVL